MNITEIIEDYTDVDDDDETALRKVKAVIESLPEAEQPTGTDGRIERLIAAYRRGLG